MRGSPLAALAMFACAACSAEPIGLGTDADRGDVARAADGPGDVGPDPVDARAGDDADAGPRDSDARPADADPADADPADVEVTDGPPVECRLPTTLPTPQCGAALCGNGTRDVCQVCSPRAAPLDAGPQCVTLEEECEGADLAGASCAARGWSWGQLGCTAACTFAAGSCAACAQALAPGCREALVDGRDNIAFDVAATAQGVALAWASSGATVGTGSAVHLALFTPDLQPVATHACFADRGERVAIVDQGSAWLLAIGDAGGVRVVALDAAGLPAGAERRIAGAREPHFASSSTGERALLYAAADGRLVLEVLGAGGAVAASVRPFADPLVDAVAVSASGNATRWFVSARHARTEVAVLDRALTRVGTLTLAADTEYPMVSAGPRGAMVTYADFSSTGTMYARDLDDRGSGGAQRLLSAIPDHFNPLPVLYDGADAWVLMAGYTGLTEVARTLSIQPLRAAGGSAASMPIAAAPRIRDWRMVPVGQDLWVGWRVEESPGFGRVGLVRVARP